MTRKLKLLTGLSTLALSGSLLLAGCGGEGEGAEGEGEGANSSISAESEGEGASASSESEGEGGEGDEGSATRSGDPATDDVEYVHQLGLIRGHLMAFMELYRAGSYDMALTHAKHPESEIYSGLVPAFEARHKSGFAPALTALSEAAAAQEDVDELYAEAMDAIRANMPDASVADRLLAVSKLVRSAGEEFDIGVDDNGVVTNVHEYQDAYGFLNSARELLSEEQTNDINESEAIAVAHEQVDIALSQFTGLIVDETEGQASTLFGAAARIEIVGLGLD